MPAKAKTPPFVMGGKKRHCYICKQVAGAAEKRKDIAKTDPIVQLYPSTPRCKPCHRVFAKRGYWKKKNAEIEQRNAARAKLGMPAIPSTAKKEAADDAATPADS